MVEYVIWRTSKIKSLSALRASHAVRSTANPSRSPHASRDPSRAIKRLVWPATGTPAEAITAQIAATGVKPRANAVLAQEFVLSATPSFFRPRDPSRAGTWDKARLEAWGRTAVEWLKAEFGERLVTAELHLDESTPHIQGVVVPITKDGRLSARDMFGPRALSQQQTSAGRAFAHLGLSRGIEGSKATHTRVSQFYGAANSPVPDQPGVEPPPVLVTRSSREEWAEAETKRIKEANRQVRDKARSAELHEREAKKARATAAAVGRERDAAREAALEAQARLREIPLEEVAMFYGLARDPDDKSQWKDAHHRIDINGAKFYDHEVGTGGGGAISLAMHLTGHDFKQAVGWLAEVRGADAAAATIAAHAHEIVKEAGPSILQMPLRDDAKSSTVKNWLVNARRLSERLVDWMMERGMVYPDHRSNAVFVMGDLSRPSGAEVRGTGRDKYARCATGTRKEQGLFVLPIRSSERSPFVLTESALDACAYAELFHADVTSHPHGFTVISTAGAMGRVRALDRLSDQSRRIVCAYDADRTGEAMYEDLRRNYGDRVTRHAPPTGNRPDGEPIKDWNDVLVTQKEATVKAEWNTRITRFRDRQPDPIPSQQNSASVPDDPSGDASPDDTPKPK